MEYTSQSGAGPGAAKNASCADGGVLSNALLFRRSAAGRSYFGPCLSRDLLTATKKNLRIPRRALQNSTGGEAASLFSLSESTPKNGQFPVDESNE